MSIAQQVVTKSVSVKRSENGVIIDPFFLTPEHTIAEADELMDVIVLVVFQLLKH